jgi:transposase
MENFEISLDIPNVKILETKTNEKGHIIVTVESTVKGTVCHKCGSHIDKPFGYDRWIVLRHLSILGHEVYIQIRPKRYQCMRCNGHPSTTQQPTWYNRNSPHTKSYEAHVMLSLVNSTISDVSAKEGLGYGSVAGIIDRNVATAVDWSSLDNIETIGIDEISIKKGHKDFVTIVTAQLSDGSLRLIGVLNDRKKNTVKQFFLSIPNRLRATVRTVCSDLYDGFINSALEVFGKQTHVVADRFHVAKLYRKCLDTLRKKEMRRLKKELPEKEYKKFKGVMWMLRKNRADLNEEEKNTLSELFKHSPSLGLAYVFSSTLTNIFEEKLSKEDARDKLTAWIGIVRNSSLNCFGTFLSTLTSRMDEIANYFIGRKSSGFVEGLNNKIKVIKRRCYGLLNIDHLFQRIHIDMTGYADFIA